MRGVRAQLIQLSRTRFAWASMGVCVAIMVFMFYQSTLNAASGVLGANAGNPATVVSLFLILMASLLGILPAVTAGSYLGGKDDGYQTAGTVVQLSGRFGVLGAKLGALGIFTAWVVLGTAALGVVLGLWRAGGWGTVPVSHIGAQMALAFAVLFMTGLLAFMVGGITRSVATANIICFVVLIGQEFVPAPALHALRWVNPMYYFQGLVAGNFPELTNVPAVTMPASADSTATGLIWGGAFLLAETVVLVVITARREVRV